MIDFIARSVVFTGKIELVGPVELVFPLFSPLGEKHWVPDWEPELLHPHGVAWEEGQIFRTREETGDAVWIVTRLDRANHRVVYHRVESNRYVARVEVQCRPVMQDFTEATIIYAFVGLSESGNQEIAAMTEPFYAAKMERWTKWINDHLSARRREP